MNHDALQEVIDFHRVSQVLYRYASSVDKKDWATLRALFVDDATARYGEYPELEGADAIVDFVTRASEKRSWLHHLIAVYHVDVVGDEATALTYHTSHQIEATEPDAVGIIVARYEDRLRRVGGEWKIGRKEMHIGWREKRTANDPSRRRSGA